MPFRGFRRYSFSSNSIRQNAPNSPGVYGISNADEWILVSSSDNMQAALLLHLHSGVTAMQSRIPTGFVFEPCDAKNSLMRERHLIAELRPVCNR